MITMIPIDMPNGYKFVRYGVANIGERYIGNDGKAKICLEQSFVCSIIIEPDRWRASEGYEYWKLKISNGQPPIVVELEYEHSTNTNDTDWNSGNYYQSEDEAVSALTSSLKKLQQKWIL